MAINVNQVFSGGAIRNPGAGDQAVKRTSGRNATEPSADTELAPESATGAGAAANVRPDARPVEAQSLDRAIEEANALSETTLRARNRSVTFGRDDGSGRITITIREEVDGEETTRQIPPPAFLELVERLKRLGEGETRGALIDLDV